MSEIRTKVITVESFLELTRQGSPLCIFDGYVIDIRNFIPYHPGGSRVLRGIIGADITQQILGLQDVDGISHSHSLAAFRKLRTLVKAKLETISSDDLRGSLKSSLRLTSEQNLRGSHLLVFREATITDYTCLTFETDIKSKPVIRISLSMKMDGLDLFSSLLPSATFVFRGKSTFGSIIERPYTPVNCFINKEKHTHTLELPLFYQGDKAMKSKVTYEFFISLVTNGEMSSYIHNKSIGDHIMVQGPMANFPLLKRIEKIRNKRHDLICIASGTGISPMLQLIDYYFDNCGDSKAAPGTNKKKQNIFLVWFLMLARNKSSSFKGAIQLDAKRKKYGSRFTYAIIYAKERSMREQPNKAISTTNITDSHHDTGENAFQRAEFMSRRLHERKRSVFRKKKSIFFRSNSNYSLNFLPKSDLLQMQCLYDERKQVNKDFVLQLISMITDHWNEQSFDEIDTSISDEMDPEQDDEVELTQKKIQSTASSAAVAICGSPMFDDKCLEIFKELGFNEEHLILFGPGDSPLIEIDDTFSREDSD